MVEDLRKLLSACPQSANFGHYRSAIVTENVLGKATESSRTKSLRYLRELYLLDRRVLLFRGLRDLWDMDLQSQPLMAVICGSARDPVLRATQEVVLTAPEDAPVSSAKLTEAVTRKFPNSYSDAIAAKIGRNAASSWTQSGHLTGRTNKTRKRVEIRPAATAFALFVGHLDGLSGQNLISSDWVRVLDANAQVVADHAFAAGQRGWIELKQAGGLTEVGFRWLGRVEQGAA